MTSRDSTTLTVRRVFIGSPRDLTEERRLFPEILTQVNKIKANALGVELKPLGWEDTLPGFGRPQELINEDVKKADLCVMLLWKRWGTPTGEYSSGFEEEYELSRDLHGKIGKPDTWLFFRAVSQEMMADPGDHLKRVLAFRKKIEKERVCLYKSYDKPQDWREHLVAYLCEWIERGDQSKPQVPIEFPPDALERIKALEKDLQSAGEAHQEAQHKLRKLALELTLQGVKAAEAGRLTEAEQAFASAVEAYPEPATTNTFGLFLYQTGSLDRAVEKFEQLEDLSESLSDKGWAAIAYGNLGNIYTTRGVLARAEEMHHKALAIDEELGYKEGMAADYGNLGIIYQTRGDLDEAEEMYHKALAIDEELGRKEGMAADYGNLGIIYKTRGDLDRAEEMYHRALELDEELEDRIRIAVQYSNLGIIYKTRGDLDEAEEMHHKALAIDEELGHKEGMAADYGNLGNVYQARADLDKAEEMYRKALALNEGLGSKEGIANQYNNMGVIYETRGDLSMAREMYQKALNLYEEVGAGIRIKRTRKRLSGLTKKKRKTR